MKNFFVSRHSGTVNLLLRSMKIFIILFFTSAMAVSATGYSQQTKISVDLQNATIKDVFEKIEAQSEYFFFYKDGLIDLDKPVNIRVVNKNIKEVLDELFIHTDYIYKVDDRQIMIGLDETKEKGKGEPEVPQPQNQKKKIIGKVTDESGLPLPGATVVAKGTSSGVTTNTEGTYSILVPENVKTLVFSFVGMKQLEIDIAGKSAVDVQLLPDKSELNEVMVVGYGTQRRRNVTGSVSMISAEQLTNSQATNITDALAGMSPGVQVSQITGEPGESVSIRIRGVGSITAGNEPLYVIDGFPTESGALSNLDVSDIESINILKDAAATSIYGSRGSNGVVLITTKRGIDGAAKISFQVYSGISQITKKMDVLSPEEYVEYAKDAVDNAWVMAGKDPDVPLSDRSKSYSLPDYFLDSSLWTRTDWQDEIYQSAPVQKYQLSARGGNKSTRYRISGGYLDENGIIKSSGLTRYTLGANLDADLTKRLHVSLDFNASKLKKQKVDNFGQWNDGVVCTALCLPGFFKVQNEDGSYPSFSGVGYNTSGVWNPMIFINECTREEDENRVMGNASFEYDIMKGLSFKSYVGFDNRDVQENYFRNKVVFDVPEMPTFSIGGFSASGTYSSKTNFEWLTENTLHYTHEWNGVHQLDALVGYTSQKSATENASMSSSGFSDNMVQTLNAGQVTAGETTKTEWSMLSYLSRINYSYNDKYVASFTIRRDGSSRFGKGNRWGYFPSFSAGWIVSEEDFMKKLSPINFLKIKTSYGVSGNCSIDDYGSISLLDYTYYPIGGSVLSGQVPSSLSNDGLGWETSHQFNVGLELGLFNNRIQFNYEYYHTINNNLLLEVPVPAILGVSNALQNIGKVRNGGMEFNLTTKNIVGKLNWTTDFNLSFNRNKVLELGPEGTSIISSSRGDSHITQIGRPIGDFYGYVFEGVYDTEEEIANHAHLSTDVPGDPIVKDVNKDGEITSDDRTVLGNYQPDFYYGMTNTFKFKNFDLSVLLQGVEGSKIMALIMRQTMSMIGKTNQLGMARDRWRSAEEPGNGKVFSANKTVTGVRREASSFYMQDGSFLRIRNITMGYNFNEALLKHVGLSKARVYVTSQNPFTFTKYIGYNPEVSTYHNALTPGVDYSNYPLAKTLTFGANLTF